MKSPLKPVQGSSLLVLSNSASPLRSSSQNSAVDVDSEWHVTFASNDDEKPAVVAKADSYFYPTDTKWFNHTTAHNRHSGEPVSVDDFLVECHDSCDDGGFADCDEEDLDDPVASQLQEWNVFASFDPILIICDDTHMYSRRSDVRQPHHPVAAAVASVFPTSWLWNTNANSGSHNHSTNTIDKSVNDTDQKDKPESCPRSRRRCRVRFQTDENGAIACTKYDDCHRYTLHFDLQHWSDEAIRDVSWYGRADFLAFRSWFHETVAAAAVDAQYRDYFTTLYHSAVCCQEESNNNGPSSLSSSSSSSLQSSSVTAAVQFSKYRGLERAIFRNELQTDKIAALKGVVWSQAKYKQQQEENNLSQEAMAMGTTNMTTTATTAAAALARTSAKLTATARCMALVLGAADATVAATLHRRDDAVATTKAIDTGSPPSTTTASRRFVEI
jgi:hypothetical protein